MLVLSMVGCARRPAARAPVSSKTQVPTEVQRQAAQEALARWRDRWAFKPGLMHLKVTMSRGGMSYGSRGVLVLDPPKRARLMILGPGGTTGMDLWLSGQTYRLSVPLRGTKLRGQGEPKGGAGRFPVAMLRWWFLHTMQGEIVGVEPDGVHVLLRPKEELWARYRVGPGPSGWGVEVERVVGQRREVLRVDHPGCGRAVWERPDKGWRVEVACEHWGPIHGGGRALRDPDLPAP